MLFSLFYDLVLFLLSLLALPFLFWQRLLHGKYNRSLGQRLGLVLPELCKKEGEKLIWIHTISMGETRALIPFFQKVKKEYPHAKVVISTITETGQAEARKSMPEADAHFYLPLDFSFTMKRMMRRLRPDAVVLVESDFWFQFLYQAKKRGAKTMLINGKLSERSFRRFSKASFFFKRILRCLDKVCVQSAEYAKRFESLGASLSQLVVTGNIKLDASLQVLSLKEKLSFKKDLNIGSTDFVITAGSTHAPEEELILAAFEPLWKKYPSLKLLLVPRHPERFDEVETLLKTKGMHYSLFSDKGALQRSSSQVILVDAMGILSKCYQISDLAIVCGSYTEKVGGHNIFEPVLLGIPVFFGPHMFSQRDLRELVKPSGAGKQVLIEDLSPEIDQFLSSQQERAGYQQKCIILREEVKGSLEKTWQALAPFLQSALQ